MLEIRREPLNQHPGKNGLCDEGISQCDAVVWLARYYPQIGTYYSAVRTQSTKVTYSSSIGVSAPYSYRTFRVKSHWANHHRFIVKWFPNLFTL